MTTNKNPNPKRPDVKDDIHTTEELKAAYQIHTLAHLVYGRLTMNQPWNAPQPWSVQPGMQGMHGAHFGQVQHGPQGMPTMHGFGPMTGPIWYW